jgi:anti-anti-sigma factor
MLGAIQKRTISRRRLPTCISFVGALDAFTAPEALARIERVVAESPSELIVDLQRLALIDSVGVRAIATLAQRINARGGKIVLVNAHGQPKLVLELLERKLNIVIGR